jgi:hypothetical protein
MLFPGSNSLDFSLFCCHYAASCIFTSTFHIHLGQLNCTTYSQGCLRHTMYKHTRKHKIHISSTGIKSAPVYVKNCICHFLVPLHMFSIELPFLCPPKEWCWIHVRWAHMQGRSCDPPSDRIFVRMVKTKGIYSLTWAYNYWGRQGCLMFFSFTNFKNSVRYIILKIPIEF